MRVRANGVELEVEDSGGAPERPAVLLIMGLGMQLIAWPDTLVRPLIDAGYRVIRYDNRDIGLSQHFDQLGTPSLAWQMVRKRLGLRVVPPYSLQDMAADALGVLDALGIRQAHVVGASMGGMIAQRLAVLAPERVLTLTSVMSSSGARGLPRSSPAVMRLLLRRPSATDRATQVKYSVEVFRCVGSPAFPTSDAELEARQGAFFDRSFHPQGVARHAVAAFLDQGRAALLGQIRAPTLVFHGKADPLVPCPCGEDSARRIAGSKLVTVEGMGHDLPPPVVERLLGALLPHLAQPVSRQGITQRRASNAPASETFAAQTRAPGGIVKPVQ